jgi:hypothetical protein
MPSPFPGMNPYLEQESIWHDFHERWCPLVAELLTAQVRPHYIVKIDEHIYIHELPAEPLQFLGRSDVMVMRPSAPGSSRGATEILEAPTRVRLPLVDMERSSFVEIRDRDSRQLITAIELLSLSNKYSGPDREQYLAKRGKLLVSPVHFVELDLLRGGPRMPFEGLPECDYYALISRAEERYSAGLWPIRFPERLPIIPIPLRPPHGDARLDLQEVLHRIYDAAGYEDYIYQGQPQPRLTQEIAAWAQQFVPSAS